MRTFRLFVLWVALPTMLALGAERQLAMLVELHPLRTVDEGVLTEVVVRVAPEDRPAIGRDVMLWAELSRREERILRRGWALKIDDPNEPLRVEIAIPEGPHVLRIDLEGGSGRAKGVWWGDVDPSAAAVATGAAAVVDPDPVPVPDLSVSEQRQDPEQRQGQRAAPDAAAGTAAGAATATEIAAATDTATDQVATTESVAETAGAPAEEGVPASEAPQPTASSIASAGPPTREPVRIPPKQVEPDEPGAPTPDIGELTVVVTRRGRAVTDLSASDIEVRVGKTSVEVVTVEGARASPLNLGVAVDLGPQTSADVAWIAGMLNRMADHVDRGQVFVDNRDGSSSGWGLAPERVGKSIALSGAGEGGGLSSLVAEALRRFSGVSGRAFLVLLTDGRSGRPGGWRETLELAEEAGVPIHVAGIWHDAFGSGLRKDLRRLAEVSGGSVFYVQGANQLDDLIDRFGAAMEGSYLVGVGAAPGAERVVVSLVDGEAEIRFSRSVR